MEGSQGKEPVRSRGAFFVVCTPMVERGSEIIRISKNQHGISFLDPGTVADGHNRSCPEKQLAQCSRLVDVMKARCSCLLRDEKSRKRMDKLSSRISNVVCRLEYSDVPNPFFPSVLAHLVRLAVLVRRS